MISVQSLLQELKYTRCSVRVVSDFHPLPLTPLVFWLHCAACGILVPGMGVEPRGTAVRVESWPLSCWGSCPSFIAAALKRVSGAKG